MSFNLESIYRLLPAVYRLRDDEQGEALKALLSVIAEQVDALQEDLAQLYDDQFIETCAEWVVPYIGDLIGYRSLHGTVPEISNPRAEVANTIAYRRRKGTAAMLEQLARDVTGWNARVVEFFQLLSTTQYLNHIRIDNQATPDLRQVASLGRLNTPFDRLVHTLEVRRVSSRRGRYNIPNVGLFLWRLNAYPITHSSAGRVFTEITTGQVYTFDPLGRDIPLFNLPVTETDITHLAEPINVPEPLERRPLDLELEGQRKALLEGMPLTDVIRQGRYFGEQPVFHVYVVKGNLTKEILSTQVCICDLSDPEAKITRIWPPQGAPYALSEDPTLPLAAVDPLLGRLALPQGIAPDRVEVSYAYGFSADLGGGPYRRNDLPAADVVVTRTGELDQALLELGSGSGIIEIAASDTSSGDLTLHLSRQQRLVIQSKPGARPVIDGALTVVSAEDAVLELDGLWITGGIQVTGKDPTTLALTHTTLLPWLTKSGNSPQPPTDPSIQWSSAGSRGTLIIDHSISGRLLAGQGVRVELSDSIVDALSDGAIALAASPDGSQPAGELNALRSTVIGQVHMREIDLVENCIFTGQVTSERKQQGCLRFTYLPPDSKVPRQYSCQPDLAVQQAMRRAQTQNTVLGDAEREEIAQQMQGHIEPIFTDLIYGRPAYLQLHGTCPVEISAGAEDGAEMGVFHDLYQPQREANLRVRLDEYLRFGIEAGIFYVT